MRPMNKTLTAALILATALAACTDDGPAYPTDIRHVNHNGRDAALYGAEIGDVCEVVGAAACTSDRCRLEHYARCNPLGASGRIEAPALESWDELWTDCLAAADRQGATYSGQHQIAGCERLTPFWTEAD
jgi:hypothetical protein